MYAPTVTNLGNTLKARHGWHLILSGDKVSMALESTFGSFMTTEIYWRDLYSWLLDQGYQLRSRYKPDWKPSWVESKSSPFRAEDGQSPNRAAINHAKRLSDGRQVVFKRLTKPEDEDELNIVTLVCREPLISEAGNHCIPVIDILIPPGNGNTSLIVMPLLHKYDSPDFDTIGEGLAFIVQLFQGLHFLHEHKVAHRDISIKNIMMDGSQLFTEMWHPIDQKMKLDFSGRVVPTYTRTERPPKYYFIDFGLSRRYDTIDSAQQVGPEGTDMTVPEFKDAGKPYNPFAVDVYCLGNLVKWEFLDGNPDIPAFTGRHGFGFLRPLIESMVQADSLARPTMDVALAELQKIVKKLPFWKLRWRSIERELSPQSENPVYVQVILGTFHWVLQIPHIVRRRAAIPGV